ncbi:MAG TPA: hypothetical protein VGO47_06725, partial [Chlamydiales bacterium]|nr:hypothetical protein [Chlamydiales bacterium]
MTSESIFALLPTELVRLVLELSAQESTQTAARLLRVSKLVNEWIQPLLYETFILDVSTLVRFFEPQSNHNNKDIIPPSRSFAPWVRNMCINFAGTSKSLEPYLDGHNAGNAKRDVHGLINACIHLSNLYLDVGFDDFRPYVIIK